MGWRSPSRLVRGANQALAFSDGHLHHAHFHHHPSRRCDGYMYPATPMIAMPIKQTIPPNPAKAKSADFMIFSPFRDDSQVVSGKRRQATTADSVTHVTVLSR
jgi:hypothetical protein